MHRPPVVFVIGHHDVDDQREQGGQHPRAVLDLRPIDPTLPRRRPVKELVAQDVEATEQSRKDQCGILILQRNRDTLFFFGEARLPIRKRRVTLLVAPEGLEDVWIVEQESNGPGKFSPDRIIEPFGVVADQVAEQRIEQMALASFVLGHFAVERVEPNPQEDELCIGVIHFLLGALDPADGSMHPRAELIVAKLLARGSFGFSEFFGWDHGRPFSR